MLVSAKEMLDKAKAGHYAVGHFNINNLEWTKAILLTAQENNSPVILGVSEGAGKYMGGYTTIVGMVNGMIKELGITVPVALHLDHGLVTDLLRQRLEEEKPDIVYACGPKVMLKFVAQMCAQYGVRCEVSLEERMACGVGACLGCATPIRREDGSVTYLHVCKDGPVFDAERVVFDE